MVTYDLRAVGELLGVSEDGINALPDSIKDGMKSVIETIIVKDDSDRKELYHALDALWQKGSILLGLQDVAKTTGIPYTTLSNLDYETQQTIVFESMMGNDTEQIYELTNKALAVIELDKVARLLSVPMRELRSLPVSVQADLCGAYAMEYDPNSTNAGLIAALREMMSA